jgi:hypothetical protein
LAHYEGTAEEIWEQCEGHIDMIVLTYVASMTWQLVMMFSHWEVVFAGLVQVVL